MNLAYKAGGYTICDDSSIAGWAQIPFCSEGAPALRGFVFGIFLHGATDCSYSPEKPPWLLTISRQPNLSCYANRLSPLKR
jgi:hypothetical protein